MNKGSPLTCVLNPPSWVEGVWPMGSMKRLGSLFSLVATSIVDIISCLRSSVCSPATWD